MAIDPTPPDLSTPRPVPLPRGALSRLARSDPAMARLIRRVGPFRLEAGKAGGHLGALIRSIVYQQLSGKAAATIHRRLSGLFEAATFPDAAAILAKRDDELRGVGLSRQKVASLRDLCTRVVSGALPVGRLDVLSDAEIVELATQVRGIGPWSAQMFLMFHLGRLDVWPETDLGVRKGVMRLYRLRDLPSKQRMAKTGERFRPYRSVATWYLWRLLDGDLGDW